MTIPAPLTPSEGDFSALHEALASLRIAAAPSASEKAWLWVRVFEHYEDLLSAGKAPKKTRLALLKFLARHAPFLVSAESASAAEALRVQFRRKYDRWTKSNRAAKCMQDGRHENSGNHRAPELSENDRDEIIRHAVMNCGGRVAQAWRELSASGKLSESLAGYYLSNPAAKSYVPRRVKEAVKYEIEAMEDIHHGPRQHKLNGAYVSRDWNNVHSLDWFQADDFTFPVYFAVPDGRGWFNLMRGQVLVMIDARCTFILGFVLLSERNYNARAIRTLITKTADKYGLPRKGFYFERGIWESSKLLKGCDDETPLSWPEAEMGLREFGLRFVHSNLPRSKPVERVGAAIQNLMEGLPGYVGRNEQIEKFERVQNLMRDIDAKKVNPSGKIFTEDEYCAALEEIFTQYNNAPQNGKMTGGLSPDEAFDQYRNVSDPPIRFSADCRFLLAHHKRPVRVTKNGITFQSGKERFNYRDINTGRLIGKTMLAWFNPETPDILTVTDLDRKNPFCVARSQDVPAMDAPPEILAQELERIGQHQAHTKARYRVLKSKYASPFRPMFADPAALELGATIARQQEDTQKEQRETQTRQAVALREARRAGMVLTPSQAARPETIPALKKLNELLAPTQETTP